MTLRADGLRFGYQREQLIFDGLTLWFEPSTVTAVTGPSGSGKSTLLYLLGALLRPIAGQVSESGREISSLSDGERSAWRASRVGFVFQDAILDPARTIVDNVCEGGFYSGQSRAMLRARSVVLLKEAGVELDFDRRPGEISGGQAQRVALCRALVKRPDIVLADEPSGNLDEGSADVVWSMLRAAATQGACVIVATHDKLRAATCDREVRV